MDVTGFGFSNLQFWAKKDLKRGTIFMSANNSFGNEFWNTLGRENSDSKTHWICFALQKCCELHFKFNEKFKEVALIFPMPNEFKTQFSSSFPSNSCTLLAWIFLVYWCPREAFNGNSTGWLRGATDFKMITVWSSRGRLKPQNPQIIAERRKKCQ